MNPAKPKFARQTYQEDVIWKVFGVALLLAVLIFIYFFFEIVLLTIGAILIAVVVLLIAAPFEDRLKLPKWASIPLAVLILTGVVVGTGYLFGTRLALDIQNVLARMEEAQNTIRASLQSSPLGKLLLAQMGSANIPVATIATSVFSVSASFMAGALVAIIAGIYFAAQPSLYLSGLLMLFPHEERAQAEETVIAVGNGLYRWLEGQFITMVLIGVLATFAWWVIGLPSPFGLGLIAGITEFIPYVGPIIGAIPALLVAATKTQADVLWTFIAYLGIHLIEGNVISPLIQRELVYVPPALMLLGISSITIVFGTASIIFAAPIVVVLFVLIKKLYVRDSLGESTPLPGEDRPQT
ncbi:MAG: AI-2E family transporter [Rhodomicrobium sp.]